MHQCCSAAGADDHGGIDAGLAEGPEPRNPQSELLQSAFHDLGVSRRAGSQANPKGFDLVGVLDQLGGGLLLDPDGSIAGDKVALLLLLLLLVLIRLMLLLRRRLLLSLLLLVLTLLRLRWVLLKGVLKSQAELAMGGGDHRFRR
jgi:hypothetical protein